MLMGNLTTQMNFTNSRWMTIGGEMILPRPVKHRRVDETVPDARAKAEKAAGHVEAAKATSKTVKSGQEEALAERKRRLSKELLEHDERRAAALKAKATPLSPRRTPQKQKQQQQLASTGDDDA